MLEVIRRAFEITSAPLTIGGGIRETVDIDGTRVSALVVAELCFESGSDKVSVGGDAVTSRGLLQRRKGSHRRFGGRSDITSIRVPDRGCKCRSKESLCR